MADADYLKNPHNLRSISLPISCTGEVASFLHLSLNPPLNKYFLDTTEQQYYQSVLDNTFTKLFHLGQFGVPQRDGASWFKGDSIQVGPQVFFTLNLQSF